MYTLADREYDDSQAWARKRVCLPKNWGEYYIYWGDEVGVEGEGKKVASSDICSETALVDEANVSGGSDFHQLTVLPVYQKEVDRELNLRTGELRLEVAAPELQSQCEKCQFCACEGGECAADDTYALSAAVCDSIKTACSATIPAVSLYEFTQHGARGSMGGECAERTIAVSADCNDNTVEYKAMFRQLETMFIVDWLGVNANGHHEFTVRSALRAKLNCPTSYWGWDGQLVMTEAPHVFNWRDDQGFFQTYDGDEFILANEEDADNLFDLYQSEEEYQAGENAQGEAI